MPNATITIEPPEATEPPKPTAPAPTTAPQPKPATKPREVPKAPARGTVGHVIAKYKDQMEDVAFGEGLPPIRTVTSTMDNPLSVTNHQIVGRAHAKASKVFQKQGRQDLAQAHLAAAKYHDETAQKKKAAKQAKQKQPAPAAKSKPQQKPPEPKPASAPQQPPKQPAPEAAKPPEQPPQPKQPPPQPQAKEERPPKTPEKPPEAKAAHPMVDRAMKAADAQGVDSETKAKYHKTLSHIAPRMSEHAASLFDVGSDGGFKFHANVDDVTRESDKLCKEDSFTASADAPDGTRTHAFFHPRESKLHLDGEHGTPPRSSLMGREDAMVGTYSHEMTHALDHGQKKKTGKTFSEDAEWQAAHAIEAKTLSNYAASSAAESFAEFGRLVYGSVVNKQKIKAICPKGYEFFKKHNLIDW